MSLDRGDSYSEEFETREQAAAVARGYGGATIAECQEQDFDLTIDFDDIHELLYCRNETQIGEGDFITCTREQGDELAREINATIDAWTERHRINRTAWTFGAVRNEEYINPPKETEASANG
ncbi:hypothetical protein [Methylosinus sp. R-45379]|uniref:hypothetical protein n=1 Tax=Methylosinus sp. R-45379 TaxID=980563 RepID=UPI001FD943CE|nr:hypothetical protein [Methylosinus sp. R-45379]